MPATASDRSVAQTTTRPAWLIAVCTNDGCAKSGSIVSAAQRIRSITHLREQSGIYVKSYFDRLPLRCLSQNNFRLNPVLFAPGRFRVRSRSPLGARTDRNQGRPESHCMGACYPFLKRIVLAAGCFLCYPALVIWMKSRMGKPRGEPPSTQSCQMRTRSTHYTGQTSPLAREHRCPR